ncbi:MAG: hypothetical protein BroJett011_29640 [Chloroflexota bacterium]|nr:MAG: hypothetical protein BroJett011_29640 [Chloroflexota bacterium]
MDSNHLSAEAITYIRSETEFNRAKVKGFLEMMLGLITGHNMHLLSFDEVIKKLNLKEAAYLGVQDIPLENIAGSTGRYEDFTRHFLPRSGNEREKERWRNIYTLAETGKGFPPIDVYKIDQVYFVKDGNHRVSVARALGWETIQAHVTELPTSISLAPDVEPDELLIKEECAYFLTRTRLDRTRPDSKHHLDFSEPSGYWRLLKHIELHRFYLEKERGQPLADDPDTAFQLAAADWYDHVYLPMLEAVRQMDVIKDFPGRSESDLYMWLIRHQAALREQHDLEKIELPEAVEEFLHSIEAAQA